MADLLDYPVQTWPINLNDPRSVVGTEWLRWFQRIHTVISGLNPVQAGSTRTVPTQHGNLPTGTLALPPLAGPAAHVNYYLERTRAGEGRIEVTVSWQRDGHTVTHTFPPLTEATLYAHQSASLPIVVDPHTTMAYRVTTSGAPDYSFSIWVEP